MGSMTFIAVLCRCCKIDAEDIDRAARRDLSLCSIPGNVKKDRIALLAAHCDLMVFPKKTTLGRRQDI